MWNNTNPAELFSGTTWELITAGKYIQSGSTALQTGGNNSVSIAKANLPNVKLKVDTASVPVLPHSHTVGINAYYDTNEKDGGFASGSGGMWKTLSFNTSSVSSSTGEFSLNTETLGNGTALNIQPTYITLKFWKRLS